MNLLSLYFKEMFVAERTSVYVVIFCGLMMMLFDVVFRRDKLKREFGSMFPEKGRNEQPEPPQWNMWFSSNRIIKTGADIFQSYADCGSGAANLRVGIQRWCQLMKETFCDDKENKYTVQKVFLMLLFWCHFPYAVINTAQQHHLLTPKIEWFLQQALPYGIPVGDVRLQKYHAIALCIETVLLVIVSVLLDREEAKNNGVRIMLTNIRLYFKDCLSENDADDASYFIAMLTDRLTEEQKQTVIKKAARTAANCPENGKEFAAMLIEMYESNACGENGLTSAGESLMGKIKSALN